MRLYIGTIELVFPHTWISFYGNVDSNGIHPPDLGWNGMEWKTLYQIINPKKITLFLSLLQ